MKNWTPDAMPKLLAATVKIGAPVNEHLGSGVQAAYIRRDCQNRRACQRLIGFRIPGRKYSPRLSPSARLSTNNWTPGGRRRKFVATLKIGAPDNDYSDSGLRASFIRRDCQNRRVYQ